MRRAFLMVVVLALALCFTACAPAKFKNCTAMHVKYKGGVAKPNAHQVGMVQQYRPVVDLALYQANKGLDRDDDGVACEA